MFAVDDEEFVSQDMEVSRCTLALHSGTDILACVCWREKDDVRGDIGDKPVRLFSVSPWLNARSQWKVETTVPPSHFDSSGE